jgi:NADH:ubiquinone oxidoreductase subunit 6 (subunit J)
MSGSLPMIPFAVLAVAALGGALRMTFVRDGVRATLWMLEVAVALSGLLLLLSAEYLAGAWLLVGAGVLPLLLLSAIALTARRRSDAAWPLDFPVAGAVIAVAACAAIVGAVLTVRVPAVSAVPPAGVEELGAALFSTMGWPFELAGIVLLAVILGVSWWTRGGRAR